MDLGISKTTFNSSVCLIEESDIEILLTERETREKASGKWPIHILNKVKSKKFSSITENRDTSTVLDYEERINSKSPLFEILRVKKLDIFCQKYNSNITEISHHYAHALSAMYMSPYNECLIIVRDGAGTRVSDLVKLKIEEEYTQGVSESAHEMFSVYLLRNGKLECLEKEYQHFSMVGDISVADGVGIMYEAVAEYIFNDKRAVGKVMGLAPYGNYAGDISIESLRLELSKGRRYTGKNRLEWEKSTDLDHFKNLANLMQQYFEKVVMNKMNELKRKYPRFDSIILTGGTALNCTFNSKLLKVGIFKNIYIPPFPGDECISFGCALFEYYKRHPFNLNKISNQHGYFGSKENSPRDAEVEKVFKDFKITYCNSVSKTAAEILNAGNVIAWYQGRSESGPRALGNRSILGALTQKNLKKYLNSEVKFREAFRPYGSSFLQDKISQYFKVDENFHSPYMSFSLKVREEYADLLNEVVHVDGTSRAQTVTEGQNQLFYELIRAVGDLTNIYGVLNTSLNIMGEPIVESLEDMRRFILSSPLRYAVVGNYLVVK